MKYDSSTQLIEIDDSSYHIEDLAQSLSKAEIKEVTDILQEANLQFPRKTRMDAMRSALRPGIVKTRAECLTLDNLLNYRLLWFNSFSEEQMNFYFEYFKDQELNKIFAVKFYRNVLVMLVTNEMKEPLKKMIELAKKYVNFMPRDIKIKEFMKSFDFLFIDQEDSLDGLPINDFRPVLYNSATKDQLDRLGKKYGITVPKKINKKTIGDYVADKLAAMGIDTTEFREKMGEMLVKDIREYALENGLETSGELNKKEYIEYILQRADSTKKNYKVPISDRAYEMNIPISDEETVYEKLVIEQARMKEEIEKATKDLKKKDGEALEAAQAEIERREQIIKEKEEELLRLQEKIEKNISEEQEKRAEQYSANPDAEFVETEVFTPNEETVEQPDDMDIFEENLEEDVEEVFEEPIDMQSDEFETAVGDDFDLAPVTSGRTSFGDASLVVYESQRQDIMIIEKTTTKKARRLGIMAILLILFITIIAIAIGAVVIRNLVKTRPMPIEAAVTSLQTTKNAKANNEAKSPLLMGKDVALRISPSNFNTTLDIEEYYTSNKSGIICKYYEKEYESDGETLKHKKEIKEIDLKNIYRDRHKNNQDGLVMPNKNYGVEVVFSNLRERFEYSLLIDYRNIITVYGPNDLSTYTDYKSFDMEVNKNKKSYESFFATVLDLDTQHHYDSKEDLKTWFLDKERERVLVNKERIINANSGFVDNKDVYDIEVYSDNAAARLYTTRLIFNLGSTGSDERVIKYGKAGDRVEQPEELNNKLLSLLEYKGVKRVYDNPDNPKDYIEEKPSNSLRKQYYEFSHWICKYDDKEEEFNLDDALPTDFEGPDIDEDGIPDEIKDISLYPVFKRKQIDLLFYENDKTTIYTGYSGEGKNQVKTVVKIENDGWLFQGFPTSEPKAYKLDKNGKFIEKQTKDGSMEREIDESKYFSHWETEDGVRITTNKSIPIDNENLYELRVYPVFNNYIESTVFLENQGLFDNEDPKFSKITKEYDITKTDGGIGFGSKKIYGKADDLVWDRFENELNIMRTLLENLDIGYTANNYVGNRSGLYIYGTKEGDETGKITHQTTFNDIRNKNIELRYNVVPFFVTQNYERFGESIKEHKKVILFYTPGVEIDKTPEIDTILDEKYPLPNHQKEEEFHKKYAGEILKPANNEEFVITYNLKKVKIAFYDNIGQIVRPFGSDDIIIKYGQTLDMIPKNDGNKEFVGWSKEAMTDVPEYIYGTNLNQLIQEKSQDDPNNETTTTLYAVYRDINRGEYRIIRNFLDDKNKGVWKKQILGYPEDEKLPFGQEIIVDDLTDYTQIEEIKDKPFLGDYWRAFEFDKDSSTKSVIPTVENPTPTITLNFKRKEINIRFKTPDHIVANPFETKVVFGNKLPEDIVPMHTFLEIENMYFDGVWKNLDNGKNYTLDRNSDMYLYKFVFQTDPDKEIVFEAKYRPIKGYLQVFLRPTDFETNKPTATEFRDPNNIFSLDYDENDLLSGYAIPHPLMKNYTENGKEINKGDTSLQNFYDSSLSPEITKYFVIPAEIDCKFILPNNAIKGEGFIYRKYIDIKRRTLPLKIALVTDDNGLATKVITLDNPNPGQVGYNPFFYGTNLKESVLKEIEDVKNFGGDDYYIKSYADCYGNEIIPDIYRLEADDFGHPHDGYFYIYIKYTKKKANLKVYTIMSSKKDNTFDKAYDFEYDPERVVDLENISDPNVILHNMEIPINTDTNVYELMLKKLGKGYLKLEDPYKLGTTYDPVFNPEEEGEEIKTYIYIAREEHEVSLRSYENDTLGDEIKLYKSWHGATLADYFVDGEGGTPILPLASDGKPYRYVILIDVASGEKEVIHNGNDLQLDELVITENIVIYCSNSI